MVNFQVLLTVKNVKIQLKHPFSVIFQDMRKCCAGVALSIIWKIFNCIPNPWQEWKIVRILYSERFFIGNRERILFLFHAQIKNSEFSGLCLCESEVRSSVLPSEYCLISCLVTNPYFQVTVESQWVTQSGLPVMTGGGLRWSDLCQ